MRYRAVGSAHKVGVGIRTLRRRLLLDLGVIVAAQILDGRRGQVHVKRSEQLGHVVVRRLPTVRGSGRQTEGGGEGEA